VGVKPLTRGAGRVNDQREIHKSTGRSNRMKPTAWILGVIVLGALLAVPVRSQWKRVQFVNELNAAEVANGYDISFLASGRTLIGNEGPSVTEDGSLIAFDADQELHSDLVRLGFTRISADTWSRQIARDRWQ